MTDMGPYDELLGMEDDGIHRTQTSTVLECKEKHLNRYGIVHGGVIFALADRAFGLASAGFGKPVVTMDMQIRYLRPANVGDFLRATATLINKGRTTVFYRIDVKRQDDKLIACLQATGHVYERGQA